MLSSRTCRLFPRLLTGISLILSLNPAALPIARNIEFLAVKCRVVPGSRISPGLTVMPSASTRIHVVSVTFISIRRASVWRVGASFSGAADVISGGVAGGGVSGDVGATAGGGVGGAGWAAGELAAGGLAV